MVKLLLGYDELTVVPVPVTKPTWTSSLPRPLTDSCTSLAPCTQVRDNMENIHTGASHPPNPNVHDTHNDGGPLGKTAKSFRSHTAKHVGPLPRPLTESCCTLSGLCTHVGDNNMENTHTRASHAHTPDEYDTHNDGGPLGKIPESVGSSVCSHIVKHVGPLPRPCGPELSKSWPPLDPRQASAHTSDTGAARTTGHNAPPCSPDVHPETATTIPGSGTMLGTLTKPNVGEHTQDTTREFQWRQTNCACAFYCVKGQYIVFQPTTTAICRTCTVVIKKYGLPLVAFTNTKLWHDPPLEILPVVPGHQQPPNIGLLPRDCWWTVATLEAPGILNKLFQH